MKTKSSTKQSDKIRVNIIFRKDLLNQINKHFKSGKRSEFINSVVEEALARKSREEAWEYIENIRKNNPLHMTTEEVIKLKNYGRK